MKAVKNCMVVATFILFFFDPSHPGMRSVRFLSSEPGKVDILDLYYDFILSKQNFTVPPRNVSGVTSKIECSLLCFGNMDFRCNAFFYFPTGVCVLLPGHNSKDKSAPYSFKRVPDCPPGFVRTENHCYSYKVGSWNFADARKQCNSINSHPLVIESLAEFYELQKFVSLPKEVLGVDIAPCRAMDYISWTSGTDTRRVAKSFLWRPFLMKTGEQPFLYPRFAKWDYREPNGPDNFCVDVYPSVEMNDCICSNPRCVICEVDI